MSEPIMDAKRLADLVYDTWRQRGMIPGVDWFVEAASAVRDAVVPEGHEVVATPLLAALRAAIDYMDTVIEFGHEDTRTVARWEEFYDLALNNVVKEWYNAPN